MQIPGLFAGLLTKDLRIPAHYEIILVKYLRFPLRYLQIIRQFKRIPSHILHNSIYFLHILCQRAVLCSLNGNETEHRAHRVNRQRL